MVVGRIWYVRRNECWRCFVAMWVCGLERGMLMASPHVLRAI
jgi:hypothetical protein